MDKDIVIIKSYRETRRKLKLVSALKGETMQDYLKNFVDRDYEKTFKEINKKP